MEIIVNLRCGGAWHIFIDLLVS